MIQSATKIVQTLQDNNYDAVFAGGCVRDMLIGVNPKDFDIATSATPVQVENIFDKTISVGKQFGVIIVVEDNQEFEVATFRTEYDYVDGRHPSKVEFTTKEDDAQRRDFTINGLFYDPISKKVYDFIDGQNGIENKIIRFIGKPDNRINDDKLRMIRALRFADNLNYAIDPKSFQAIKRNCYKINSISKERIRGEIIKVFSRGNGVHFILDLIETHLVQFIIPELLLLKGCYQSPIYHPEGDVLEHTLLMLKECKNNNPLFKLSLMFHDIGKPQTYEYKNGKITNHGHPEVGAEITRNILKRLSFSNDEINYIVYLVKYHLILKDVNNMRKSTFKKYVSNELFPDLLELHRIDCVCSNGDLSYYKATIERMNKLDIREKESLPVSFIGGKDLISLGFKQGKILGIIIKKMQELQLNDVIKSKVDAIKYIKKGITNGKYSI